MERKPLVIKDGRVTVLPDGDTVGGMSGGGYQKYKVAPLETYTIPDGISSVITGNMEIEGVLVLEGRLEIL